MITAILPDTQSRVEYVVTLINEQSAKTGIPAKKIFCPGRKAEGKHARNARAAVWRKLRRARWTYASIGSAFNVNDDYVSQVLKGLI